MRLTRIALRVWIALTSVFSFLIGWAMLAHSPKPVQAAAGTTSAPSQAVVVAPLPTLAPLAPLDLTGSFSGAALPAPQIVVQAPPRTFSQAPIFTTGGS